jgi:hypothetical protein
MMKLILISAFLGSLFFMDVASAVESHEGRIVVLNDRSFIKIDKSDEHSETVQLFKVEGDKISLVDAILVTQKIVNMTPNYEYQRLKIDLK